MLGQVTVFLMFFELKITKMLKSGRRVLEKNGLPWKHDFSATGVLHVELLAYQVSIVSVAN